MTEIRLASTIPPKFSPWSLLCVLVFLVAPVPGYSSQQSPDFSPRSLGSFKWKITLACKNWGARSTYFPNTHQGRVRVTWDLPATAVTKQKNYLYSREHAFWLMVPVYLNHQVCFGFTLWLELLIHFPLWEVIHTKACMCLRGWRSRIGMSSFSSWPWSHVFWN